MFRHLAFSFILFGHLPSTKCCFLVKLSEKYILQQLLSQVDSYKLCRTLVYSSSENKSLDGCNEDDEGRSDLRSTSPAFQLPIIPSIITKLSVTINSGEFFGWEHTEKDLTQISNILRYSPQCRIVLITANRREFSTLSTQVLSLYRDHVANPAKDHYFFLGQSDMLNAFRKSSFPDEILFKYYVTGQNISIPTIVFSSCPQKSTPLLRDKCSARIFGGRTIRVTASVGKGAIRFDEIQPNGFKCAGGIYYHILAESARKFNFTFSLKFANSNGATGFKKDGKWYGAVGEVFNREADLGVGMGMTATRSGIVDNGVSFGENKRVFYIRDPPRKANWRAIFSPFQASVWLGLIVSSLVLVPVYYASVMVQLQTVLVRRPAIVAGELWCVVMSTLVAIIVEQSSPPGVKFWIGTRIRALTVLWILTGIIIGAGYRSRLIYALTFVPTNDLPTTHSDLIARQYRILFRNYGGIAYHFTRTSNDSVQKAIFRRAFLLNTSQDCIIASILTPHSACLDWESNADYAVAANVTFSAYAPRALIIKSKHSVLTTLMGWAYRKGSPLRTPMDEFLLTVFASGLYQKWLRDDWIQTKVEGGKWLHENQNYAANSLIIKAYNYQYAEFPKALDLAANLGTLAILGVGSIVAILICSKELIFTKIWPKIKSYKSSFLKI